MVKKLVYVVGLIALSSTVLSSAHAAGTKRERNDVEVSPDRTVPVKTPRPPKSQKIALPIMTEEEALAAGFDLAYGIPLNIAPRRLF